MNIVVLDGYSANPGDLSWDALKEMGDVTVYDRTSGCSMSPSTMSAPSSPAIPRM